MKKTIIFAVLLSIFCLACGKVANQVSNTAHQKVNSAPTATEPKDGNYDGRGTVTKIDTKIGSVEMDHEEVRGLMPAMRMEFYVSDKAMLNGLAVGDVIDFTILYKGGTETIVRISKNK